MDGTGDWLVWLNSRKIVGPVLKAWQKLAPNLLAVYDIRSTLKHPIPTRPLGHNS